MHANLQKKHSKLCSDVESLETKLKKLSGTEATRQATHAGHEKKVKTITDDIATLQKQLNEKIGDLDVEKESLKSVKANWDAAIKNTLVVKLWLEVLDPTAKGLVVVSDSPYCCVRNDDCIIMQ